MQATEDRYSRFALVREMLETPGIVSRFDTSQYADVAARIATVGRLLMTGEGSSRIFPALQSIAHARRAGWNLELHTEAGQQACEYALDGWAVFALSNSGRTSEVVRLFQKLKERDHTNRYSLSSTPQSLLEELATQGFVLSCGKEQAVAATKSVMEQALAYRAILEHTAGSATLPDRLTSLGQQIEQALTTPIDAAITDRIARAGTIYWAGRNDGVAEELTLKTNEITRKKSDFLEGTYAVHGIEEVMDASDVVLWVDPHPDSESKFRDVLCKGVGLDVFAISSRDCGFPTIRIPEAGDLSGYVQLAAGWNVLVEVGLQLGINLDQPQRARKVGNEFTG